MYPKWMKNLIVYFDLWGFCTQFKVSPRQQKFDRLLFSIHLSLVSVATFGIGAFLIRPTNDNMGLVMDVLKLGANLIVYWFSILESYLKRQMQRKFWKALDQIGQRHRQCFRFDAYRIKMIIFFILLALMYLNYYILFISTDESAAILYFFWVSFTLIVVFGKHQMFYYLFHLEFIKHELNIFSTKLIEMQCACGSSRLKNVKIFEKNFRSSQFKWIREFNASIYDLSDIVNAVFGWTNVASVSLSFLFILADTNWLYWKLFNKYRIDLIGKILLASHEQGLKNSFKPVLTSITSPIQNSLWHISLWSQSLCFSSNQQLTAIKW